MTEVHAIGYKWPMASALMDRIPSRGITKAEHDAYVAMRDKPYTAEPFVRLHLGKRSTDGGRVPPHKTATPRDPRVHAPTCH